MLVIPAGRKALLLPLALLAAALGSVDPSAQPAPAPAAASPGSGPILPEAASTDGRPEDSLGLSAYDAEGRLLYQRRVSGALEEVRLFSYRGSALQSLSLYLGDGPPLVFRYIYGPDGRLLSLRAEAGELAGSSPSGNAWYSYADGRGRLLVYSSYGSDGKLLARLSYRADDSGSAAPALELEELYAYEDGRPVSLTVRDIAAQTERVLNYDESGRPWREKLSLDGKEISWTERLWDGQGRLSSESLWTLAGGDETVAYEYGESGELSAERRSKGGLPVLVRLYEADGVVVEELYDKGLLFARVWKKDGRAFKEQIVRDGAVLRERTLP